MAVQDYLDNYTAESGEKSAINCMGVRAHNFQNTATILAADSNGSQYLLAKNLPSTALLRSLELERSQITDGTDYDIGFFDSETGEAVDADVLMNGGDFSAAATTKVAPMDGMPELTHAETLQPIYKLLNKTLHNRKPTYDLVLTANVVGSVDGTVTVRGQLLPAG